MHSRLIGVAQLSTYRYAALQLMLRLQEPEKAILKMYAQKPGDS